MGFWNCSQPTPDGNKLWFPSFRVRLSIWLVFPHKGLCSGRTSPYAEGYETLNETWPQNGLWLRRVLDPNVSEAAGSGVVTTTDSSLTPYVVRRTGTNCYGVASPQTWYLMILRTGPSIPTFGSYQAAHRAVPLGLLQKLAVNSGCEMTVPRVPVPQSAFSSVQVKGTTASLSAYE